VDEIEWNLFRKKAMRRELFAWHTQLGEIMQPIDVLMIHVSMVYQKAIL